MEVLNKPCNDQEKKKTAFKISGGGGGGIGAVILLGGALATAALASAFVVGKKGRISAMNRGRQNSEPAAKVNKNEQDEADKREEFVSLDKLSSVAKEEVKSEKDTALLVSPQSLKLDEKPEITTNGGIQGDSYDVAKSVVLDSDVLLDEKLAIEPKGMKHGAKVHFAEDVTIESISKEINDFKQVDIDKERKEGAIKCDDEVKGSSYEEAVEVSQMQIKKEKYIDVLMKNQVKADKKLEMEKKIDDKELERSGDDNGEVIEEVCEAVAENKLDLGANTDVEMKEVSQIKNNQEGDALLLDGAVKEVYVDQMEAEKNVIGEISQLKFEGIEKNYPEVALVADAEMKMMNDVETDREQGEVTNVTNAAKRVDTDNIVAEPNSYKEAKELQDGEISAVKCVEAIDKTEVAVGETLFETLPPMKEGAGSTELVDSCEVISSDQELVSSNRAFSEIIASDDDEQEDEHPMFDGPVIAQENGHAVTEMLEIVQKDEIIEECQENEGKHVEEELVKESDFKQPAEEAVPEKCVEAGWPVEVNVEDAPENKEDNAPIPENTELGAYDERVQIVAVPMPKQELDVPTRVETVANEKVAESLEHKKHSDDAEDYGEEVEDSSETKDRDTVTVSDDLIVEMSEEEQEVGEDDNKSYGDEADETDLSDEAEEISEGTQDSSTESNSEAVWPAESLQEPIIELQQVKLVDQVENVKTEDESKQVKAVEGDFYTTVENSNSESKKSIMGKYLMELGLIKDLPETATRRKMVIGTVSILSSLSCSWLFGLSFIKLSLIVFLSMVLATMHGY